MQKQKKGCRLDKRKQMQLTIRQKPKEVNRAMEPCKQNRKVYQCFITKFKKARWKQIFQKNLLKKWILQENLM